MDFFREKLNAPAPYRSLSPQLCEEFKLDCIAAWNVTHTEQQGFNIRSALMNAIDCVNGERESLTDFELARVKDALGLVLRVKYSSILIKMKQIKVHSLELEGKDCGFF